MLESIDLTISECKKAREAYGRYRSDRWANAGSRVAAIRTMEDEAAALTRSVENIREDAIRECVGRVAGNLRTAVKYVDVEPEMVDGYLAGAAMELLVAKGMLRNASPAHVRR